MKKIFFLLFFVCGNAFAVTTVLRPQSFNIKDYGAVCDGVTDDYTAIQTALSTAAYHRGGSVIGSGTCVTGTRLVIYSSTTFGGLSEGSFTLKAKSTLNTKMLVNQAWGGVGTDSNIHIVNMIFDEQGATHGAFDDTSLTLARVDYSTVEKCRFINGTSGLILLTGATYDDNHHVSFIDDVFDSSNLHAGGTDINDFGNGKDIQIIRCTFLGGYANSGNVQISAAGMDDFVIQGCYFDGQGNGNAMNILGIHGGGLFDNYISSSNGRCVNISQFNEGNPKRTMYDWKIDGNTFDRCGDMSIWMSQNGSSTDTIRDISITNNKFQFSGKSSINIELSSGVVISGNAFESGSRLSSGTYAVINATAASGITTISNINVFGNHFYDTASTPSQTKLYQLNFVSTFTSHGNIAENITTRSIVTNTTGFMDFDLNATDALTPSRAMVTTTSGTYTTSVVTSTEIAVLSGSRYKVGSLTRSMTAVSAGVSYTGVGFSPKSVIFLAGNGAAISVGLDTVANHGVISTFGTTYTDTSNQSIYIVNGSDVGQKGVLSSLDADGFTISWTESGSPSAGTADVYYLAFK